MTYPGLSTIVNIKISLVSTFGPSVRGISPYSDELLDSLRQFKSLDIQPIDFVKMYPDFLYPGKQPQLTTNPWQAIHYAKPKSWREPFSNNPDMVHLQYWNFTQLPIYLSIARQARKLNIPCLLTVHNTKGHESIKMLRVIEKQLFSSASILITHTQNGIKDLIAANNTLEGRIHCIPHGTSIIQAVAEPQVNSHQLLFFGNIRHYKGLDVLLDAWPTILEAVPEASLVIAGRLWDEGNSPISTISGIMLGQRKFANKIRAILQSGNLRNVEFKLDFIEEDEAVRLIQTSKLGIFPYRHFNAQSGATLKAASLGLPVIVTDTGGLPDITIDDSFICKPGSSDDLAKVIQKKLEGWRPEWRKLQQDRLEKLKWSHVAELTEQIYRKALKSGAG